MLLAVMVHYVVGEQIRIVQVSELIIYNDNFSSSSGNYNSSHVCCVYGNCTCNSLDHALANLNSNVLINITTNVTLSSLIDRSNLQNVSIIGHNDPTVNCKNDAGIHFKFCRNCIIQGIAWNKCGLSKAGLKLSNYSNVTIQNCSFQSSLGRVIVLSEVSGNININDCNFVNNTYSIGHGAAIHYCSNDSAATFVFYVNNCRFTQSKHGKSLIYIENGFEHSNMTFCNSVFQDNIGVSIFLVNQKILLNGKLLFQNNNAVNGTGIHISNHSTVVFGEDSNVTFVHNSADDVGGAIFSRNLSTVLFDQNSKVTFISNSGKYGAALCSLENSQVIFTENSEVKFESNFVKDHNQVLRGIIYIANYVNISFESNATALFSNNTAYIGGAIYAINNCHISLKANSSVVFSNNTADYGGAVYVIKFSSIYFEGNSTGTFDNNIASKYGGAIRAYDNSNIRFEGDSTTVHMFNNNTALHSGGAIGAYKSSISFEGNSVMQFSNNGAGFGGAIFLWVSNIYFKWESATSFNNNNASNYGGAIRTYDNSNITFEGNSVVQFSNNTGTYGGAVYLRRFSNIYFEGNSTTMFSNNTVLYHGGAIRNFDNSNVYFKGNSTTEFSNNAASYYGGAICSFDYSNICFQENSSMVFNNNTAYYGGAISGNYDSTILFKGNSITQFSVNIAKYGGAIDTYTSSMFLKGNCTVLFSNNIASLYGAVAYADSDSDITFDGNSKVIISNNKAADSTIIYSKRNSKIMATGDSSVIFNDIPAKWCNNVCLQDSDDSHNDFLKVDSSGIVRCSYQEGFTCQTKKCNCSKFKRDLDNDSLIIITDTMILSSPILSTNLRNISIIGHNNPFVYCVNSSRLTIINSTNVVIEGITLIGCGNKELLDDITEGNLNILDSFRSSEQPMNSVIYLHFSINVTIQHCTFQYSEGRVIVISESSGEMKISHCNFLNNSHSGHGAAVHYTSKNSSQCLFTIKDSKFAHNNKFARSLVYIENKMPEKRDYITICDSNFYHNLGVCIHVTNQQVYLTGKVSFLNNNATNGSGIYITNHSTITFGANSNVAFTENIATHKGSAVFLQNHSMILFDQSSTVKFQDNNATSGTVYSETNSNVIFNATSLVTFNSNSASQYGAAIHCFDYSNVTFKGNTSVHIINNMIVSPDWQYGGTIFSENNGHVFFEGDAVAWFNNNNAVGRGAAITIIEKSNVNFKDRSRVTFSNNTAINGGAVALYDNCTATIEQLSNITFTNNFASQCGGALHCSHNSNVSFTDKSTTLFADNRAEENGGAVCYNITSSIKIKKDSIVIFENNTASFGENLYSIGSSYTDIRNDNLIINNNTARWHHVGQFTNKNNVINDIIIDANGIIRCNDHKEYYICQYKKCYCENIEDIPSNVVVIITKNISLSSSIQINNRANISLIGHNNSFIHCENESGLQFISCSDVMVINLTWHKSINNERNTSNNITPQIKLYNSSNVTIDNCSFQQSVGQAVVLSEVSGDVNIKHCKFVNNKYSLREHGAAIHYSSNSTEYSKVHLIISDCHFTDNLGIASLIHLEKHYNHSQCESIILQNSKFTNNQGICLYLSNQNLYIKGNVLFENNTAENGTGFIIDDHSKVAFGNASNVTFVHNSATINGGAIFVSNWSSVVFERGSLAIFTDNKATSSGGTIYSYNYSGILLEENSTVWFGYSNAEFGGTLYIENNSYITTKGTYKLTITDSKAMHGGALYSTQNCNITITENSTIEFCNNEAREDGGCIFSNYGSTLTFKGNSITTFYNSKAIQGGVFYSYNNSGITLDDNSKVWFNKSTAVELGGTLYIEAHSYIITKGISILMICDSTSINGVGGGIYSNLNSSIRFKGNSTITVTENKAEEGGAIYSTNDSNTEFDNNSTTVFYMNKATLNGGCIFTEQSTIEFKGTCKVTFNNSVVFNGAGGAIFCRGNSNIRFISCNVTFFKNRVNKGEGGAICCTNSTTVFDGISYVEFYNNQATHGGAADIYMASLLIRSNTLIIFSGNSAIMGGAINFHGNSNGIFEMNSTVLLKENNALQNGGAFHIGNESNIEFKQSVNAEFIKNSAESGGAIFLIVSNISYENYSSVMFKNNIASQDGGAIYIANQSHVTFMESSKVTFSHNTARNYGGAIYGEMVNSKITSNNSTMAIFHHNTAGTTGNSVYISLPKQCNNSCLIEGVLGMNTSDLQSYFITSPHKIKLYGSKVQCLDIDNDTECDLYYIQNIMLGQKILLDACMYDYYNLSVDVARFLISGNNNQGYYLESNNTLITCNRTLELTSIYGNENTSTPFNYSVNISLYDNHQSDFREVMTRLIVELSPCHPGFSYEKSQRCECYNASDIVFCSGSSSTIKRGYWFGNVTRKPTVAFCPINYCNFTCCETSNGYYHLSPVRDNQCSAHRSGAACGNCAKSYTLSYDSTDCINVDSCTIGYTVLVVLLSIIYWIAMVTLVFGMMYYKVGIGYLYGITYYYSIVDILLSRNMYASSGLGLTVNIMSSFSKIIPQFLGKLCLITGLEGIDQQFIHYIHPLAVILILIIISLLARRSQRISVFISRGIIHVICLLLLLSYTSIASTSLLLMRSLHFDGIHEVYTYLSPDIEYFHDRHLLYGIVALLFLIFVAIGLPLLLTLEPFLNHKFNFTKIKPLLDQFQGCYKDKYRCFAGYYMICRLVIITIVIPDASNDFVANYLLIITCGIIALIHLLIKPYNSGILNKLDGVILQLIIFTEALSLFDDYNSPLVITLSFVFVFLPLLMIIGIAIFLHKDDFRKSFRVKSKSLTKTELLMADYHLIVSNDMRENATTCDV